MKRDQALDAEVQRLSAEIAARWEETLKLLQEAEDEENDRVLHE